MAGYKKLLALGEIRSSGAKLNTSSNFTRF